MTRRSNAPKLMYRQHKRCFLAAAALIGAATIYIYFGIVRLSKPPELEFSLVQAESSKSNCSSLVVRTQLGLQSRGLGTCKTPESTVDYVCLPMCGSQSFVVDVADNSGDDKVLNARVNKCNYASTNHSSSNILVVFRMTRVFNGFHMYHVLNNFVVNLDPSLLDKYVFYCWGEWGCPVEFSDFFDLPLKLNSRMVDSGCYSNYIMIGEHYATYNVDRDDVEKSKRWRAWADVFKKHWCPAELLSFDDRYFTHLDRSKAQNGRNMNGCKLASHNRTRYVIPSLTTVAHDASIFCNTRLIFSAEGNGLTNMFLLPPHSTVVVLWQSNRPAATLQVIYGNMAKLLGINMVPIPVESDPDHNANCSAELNDLLQVLY
jgi:hypothetical protein